MQDSPSLSNFINNPTVRNNRNKEREQLVTGVNGQELLLP